MTPKPALRPLDPVRKLPGPERSWLTTEIREFARHVQGSLVPRGYEAYVRIPHAVDGEDPEAGPEDTYPGDYSDPNDPTGSGDPNNPTGAGDSGDYSDPVCPEVSWAEVAAWSGRALHPLVEWETLSTPVDPLTPGRPWDGEEPGEGTLGDGQLAALLPLLAAHTTTPEECFFGLWDGFGFLHKGGVTFTIVADTPEERASARADMTANWPGLDVSRLPLLHLPERDYLLFRGPVRDADRVGVGLGPYANEDRMGPNLTWPADRSWFLATEIDLTSTYLACTRALADSLLAAPDVEALVLPPKAPVL